MRMKSLAAFVAISMCLTTAAAWGSDWDVDTGFWSTPGSWSPVGVPNGVAANITNGGTATLQSGVDDITTFQLAGALFDDSELIVLAGADLTTTGDASIGTGSLLENDALVTQSGGSMSVGASLIIGSDDAVAEWRMSGAASVVNVATNLTVGNGGDGTFSMSDGALTVHGGDTRPTRRGSWRMPARKP